MTNSVLVWIRIRIFEKRTENQGIGLCRHHLLSTTAPGIWKTGDMLTCYCSSSGVYSLN